jgi:hypothetical protein
VFTIASVRRGKKQEANCEPQHTAAHVQLGVTRTKGRQAEGFRERGAEGDFGPKMEKVTGQRIKTA